MADIHPDLVRAKESAETRLLAMPGVTGVDIGYKEVNGEPTGALAIRVLVAEKKPAKKLSDEEKIPDEIDGFPTDVIQRKFELHQVQARVREDEITLQSDTGKYNPLKGGISIGPCRAVGGYVYVGTLGAIVKDNVTGKHWALSNFHVMCIDNTFHTGDTMAQPGRVDAGQCPADVVGGLQRESLGGQVDCAVCDINSTRTTSCEIVDIGTITGTGTASIGQAVRKRGRTTGLTYGVVDSVHLTVTINYGPGIGSKTLTNQIGVKPDTAHNPKFGDHGDSGSVVVDNNRKVVGLHFAGDDTGYGIANPIAAVLSALNVSMCVAKAVKEKIEHKDFVKDTHKDKFEKIETKELKAEVKDNKDHHPEKPIKEFKEVGSEGPGGPGGPGDPAPLHPGGFQGGPTKKLELKDKPEKLEIKDHKEKSEHKDFKDGKDHKEHKEHKVESKEHKGEMKDIHPDKHPKEVKEGGKELSKDGGFEGPGGPGGPDPAPIGSLKPAKPEKPEGKDLQKDKPEFKEHKSEAKDHKDGKDHKNENKDNKPEAKEQKDQKNEGKEHKDNKDHKDHKEQKEQKHEKGESKELAKPEKPESDKLAPVEKAAFVENFPQGGVEQRLAALEGAVGQLAHFIQSAQRPDLSQGALTGEPDLAARSAELKDQADSAKTAKDQKDFEKLSDA